MVEFAIICFVLTAMLAAFLGLIVLGLGSFQNQLAAESAGRLLDQTLPAELTSSEDVYSALAERDLYDEKHLIISQEDWFNNSFRSNLPEINRSLLGSYIYDPDRREYRYPGAVVTNANNEKTVLIPLLRDESMGVSKGIDRALNVSPGDTPVSEDWVGPVTISKIDDTKYRVVVFYPSQPSSLLNIEVVRDADGKIISQTPVEADDGNVNISDVLPDGYSFDPPIIALSNPASPNRGKYGLGESYAFLRKVRPYRRVFESATVFRLAEE